MRQRGCPFVASVKLSGLLLAVGDHHVDGEHDGDGGDHNGAVEGLLVGGAAGLGVIQHGGDGLADPGGSGIAQEHDAVVDADVAGAKGATGERRVDDEQGAKAKAEQGECHKEHALRKAHRHDDERDDGDDKADEQRLIGAELVDDLAKGQAADQVGAGVDGDHHTAEGDELLTIQQPDGVRYIMLRSTIEGHAKIGLAEDVTAAVLERKRIEHERDHDILTGLYNRQAFNRVCTELFAAPERMGVAALMMMDLDNLKHINDTYGHDWGDQYIRRTGQCLRDNTPAGTVCARLSGDEFLVLFHGYRSRDAVREKIDRLTKAMQQSVALLPSGNALHISLSGGIAWYPDDGQDWETLKKYADFAMYQVKHSEKGRVEEFDIGVYNREAYAERTRREFRQLLSNAQVFYCFQPIFSARSGRVVAYEALMRSDLPTLRSPATIMKLAREQGALYEIERLTFTKALETFDSLCRAGSVSGDAMLFVNSIASTCLSHEDGKYINSHWHELCRRMVVEITEEEEIDYEALERKRNAPGFSGMFALDDYGSGYSNENTLLQLAPRFVKVDITIIRGIDTSPDKQQILRNMVAYAHPRSMKIVAEGVETAAELCTVIELGADLLQGYFLARPAIVPGAIAPEAAGIIQELQRRKKD